MGVAIPAGYGQAVFGFSASGLTRQMSWTLGVKDDDYSSASETAEAIYTAWTASGRPYAAAAMITGWTFNGVSVTYQLEDGPEVGQYLVPLVGSASNSPLVVNSAALMKKNTSRGGRKGRGRAFLPPTYFGESSVDMAGVITGSLVVTFQGLVDAAVTAMNTAGIHPYLLHEDGTLPNAITSMSVQTVVATQRRRLR